MNKTTLHWPKIDQFKSSNKSVSKFVFTKDDAVVESVLYQYPTFKERTVICCSTMSGCPVGCRFCGAGDNFVRALTNDEIYDQPRFLLESQIDCDPQEIGKLQIMFMSMGEPLLNFQQLRPALIRLYDDYPKAALLISTSGPRFDYRLLRDLSCEIPTIGLQFSIHETTNEARNKLIPFKQKLTLEEIAEEGVKWHNDTRRRPFFNYCVHEGNSSEADANRLHDLFFPGIWEATLSVICERDEHVSAANNRQRDLTNGFMEKMLKRGFSTRMFDPAGQDDIGGGCGQLWSVQDWMQNNQEKVMRSCGHGLPKIHAPSPNDQDIDF